MQFRPFDKIPRLFRDVTITEKIDGTNASILIEHRANVGKEIIDTGSVPFMCVDDFIMVAGSRTRWISEKSDNYGFGKWVSENRYKLINLGPGHHFGEWWGSGIQRSYGLKEKRFSLFNTKRWGQHTEKDGFVEEFGCYTVPVLNQGPLAIKADQDIWDLAHIADSLSRLRTYGSVAAPGFMQPEGIIVYHEAGNHLYKVLLENDEIPKGLQK